MKYQNVLFTIFCIVAIIILIVSIKQDLDMGKICKEQLENGEFSGCRLCCEEFAGTIIADTNFINVTINLTELNLESREG